MAKRVHEMTENEDTCSVERKWPHILPKIVLVSSM